MFNVPFHEGQEAFMRGYSITENPYRDGTHCAWDWEEGFCKAGNYGAWRYNSQKDIMEERGA
jgi:hypothetical protein